MTALTRDPGDRGDPNHFDIKIILDICTLLRSIVTLQSARPFTLFVGFDANNDGNPVTDRVSGVSRNTYRGDSLQTFDLRLPVPFISARRPERLQSRQRE
jgi:hypothetical protein